MEHLFVAKEIAATISYSNWAIFSKAEDMHSMKQQLVLNVHTLEQ